VPVFKEKLMAPTTMERRNDATPRILRIHDMEPIVFRVLLHFIYTDSLPDIAEGQKIGMAKDLLVVADRYRVERLKLICEKMLRGWVDPSTVTGFLGFAGKHGCKGVENMASFAFCSS
jgi:speckle-type POZ protein